MSVSKVDVSLVFCLSAIVLDLLDCYKLGFARNIGAGVHDKLAEF